MFAYLISEVLCNIYQVCRHLHSDESFFSGLTATFGSREVSLESIFKAPGRKIICDEFILSLLRKLVFSFLCMTHSHEAPCRDGWQEYIPINTHESRFSKSTERIKSKTSLSKCFSKRRTAKLLVSRLLGLSLQKLRSENPDASFCIFDLTVKIKPSMLLRHLNWPIRCRS